MNEVVEKYLERKLEEKNDNEVKLSEMELKKREDFLIKEGLFEKIYSDSTEYDDEYPEIEYLKSGDFRYYKRVMIDLTEEEWEAVLAAYNETKDKTAVSAKETKTVSVMKIATNIIAIIGAIYSVSVLDTPKLAIQYLAVTGAAAVLLYGICEAVRLLEEINKKLK